MTNQTQNYNCGPISDHTMIRLVKLISGRCSFPTLVAGTSINQYHAVLSRPDHIIHLREGGPNIAAENDHLSKLVQTGIVGALRIDLGLLSIKVLCFSKLDKN